MWMQILIAGGFPYIGEQFPKNWHDLIYDANPDGFYESALAGGVYFRTNPHPKTGVYLFPQQTEKHAVKIFIPGLVRSDIAFINVCIATVRPWRQYHTSLLRLKSMGATDTLAKASEIFPPILEWWCENFALIRDLATRRYAAHVLSYESLLQDPEKVIHEVFTWLEYGDAKAAMAAVKPSHQSQHTTADDFDLNQLPEGITSAHWTIFDEFYQSIHRGEALSPALIQALNQVDNELRPLVLRCQASLREQLFSTTPELSIHPTLQ